MVGADNETGNGTGVGTWIDVGSIPSRNHYFYLIILFIILKFLEKYVSNTILVLNTNTLKPFFQTSIVLILCYMVMKFWCLKISQLITYLYLYFFQINLIKFW